MDRREENLKALEEHVARVVAIASDYWARLDAMRAGREDEPLAVTLARMETVG